MYVVLNFKCEMTSSFIVDLGVKGNYAGNASVSETKVAGYLEFLELDASEQVQSDRSQSAKWKILMSFNDDNLLCRKLRQKTITEGNRLPIVELRALPDRLEHLKGKVWVKPKGKLCYNVPKVYLNDPASSTRIIFQGLYEYDIPVAIQKIKLESQQSLMEIEREFQILRQLENHENFIRYFCHEEDALSLFVFIATEICACSVADLYEPRDIAQMESNRNILQSLQPKEILFQATRGLEYLHSSGYVHRNVKPSSFLIKEVVCPGKGNLQYVIKIADFRLSRNALDGGLLSGTVASEFWEAPESRRLKQKLNQSLDVFILGCFYHYVLLGAEHLGGHVNGEALHQKPLHPFGNNFVNIVNQNYVVYTPEWQPSVRNDVVKPLIKQMLSFDESKRPSLSQVLEHSFFQTSTSREYYPIYFYPKTGWCAIFNHEKFIMSDGSSHRRTGSREDCERLNSTFTGLGYHVEIFHDMTSIELKLTIKELARKVDLSNYGSLVVCLLSHGFDGSILCSDGIAVNINRLKSEFSLQKCPHLYGKPKIFIVQACRANLNSDEGNHFIEVRETFTTKLKEIFGRKSPTRQARKQGKTDGPPLLDFLTINATLPGSLACRNSKGSYFVQALCDALDAEYFSNQANEEKRDFESVLRGDNGVQSFINSKTRQNDKTWQTMQWEACLTKYIRFKDCRSEEQKRRQMLRAIRVEYNGSQLLPLSTEYDSSSHYNKLLSKIIKRGLVVIVPLIAVTFYYCYRIQ